MFDPDRWGGPACLCLTQIVGGGRYDPSCEFVFDPDRGGDREDPVCLCLTQIMGVAGRTLCVYV